MTNEKIKIVNEKIAELNEKIPNVKHSGLLDPNWFDDDMDMDFYKDYLEEEKFIKKEVPVGLFQQLKEKPKPIKKESSPLQYVGQDGMIKSRPTRRGSFSNSAQATATVITNNAALGQMLGRSEKSTTLNSTKPSSTYVKYMAGIDPINVPMEASYETSIPSYPSQLTVVESDLLTRKIDKSEEIFLNYNELADDLAKKDLELKYGKYDDIVHLKEWTELNNKYINLILKYERTDG